MKTTQVRYLSALILGATVIFGGCSKEQKADAKETAEKAEAAAKNALAHAKTAIAESWDNIKDYSHEKRADAAAALGRLSDKFDAEMEKLKAKRSTLSDTAKKDWDVAVKELDEARADLKVKTGELGKASAETWSDAKERAAKAWKRVQEAAAKVKEKATS